MPEQSKSTGYSSASQNRKLGIKPGMSLAFDHVPENWSLQEPPTGVATVNDGPLDFILTFVRETEDVRVNVPHLARQVYPHGMLWIAWPRKAAGHISDVTENLLREVCLPLGIVDVKVAAIDHDWSGLKFVWRKELRGHAEPPAGYTDPEPVSHRSFPSEAEPAPPEDS